jgi:uncharacterized protein
MDYHLLIENITNPALLFFVLGIVAVLLKSDLEIPPNSSKFISLYLLFSIGFKGGQELSHEPITGEIAGAMIFGLLLSALIPWFAFFILKARLSLADSGAVAASYGSVSAVTFVTAVSYLEAHQHTFHGYMVAVMALMESPAIIMGLVLVSLYQPKSNRKLEIGSVIRHSITNGSVLLILGSLIIGFIADTKQAEGIKPFTTDLFKGFLAIFLLDMGIHSGRKLRSFFAYGWFPLLFAIFFPLVNGCLIGWLSGYVVSDVSSQFMFAILAASASYIAVPAAMKIAIPTSDPGLYLPMALAVTFPVNITVGMPIYFWIAQL